MNYIKLSAENNKLKITEDCFTTGGSINYDACSFTFDDKWDGFVKTAVFSINNEDNYRVPIEDNTCVIPSVCIEKEGILRIGVFGVNDDNVLITTNTVAHRVEEGVENAGEWVEEDGALVMDAIKELKKYAEEYTKKLSERVSAEIAKLGNADKSTKASMPPDWFKPRAFEVTDEVRTLTNGRVSYELYLDFVFNKLVNDFPEYVIREELGSDTNGTNKIYSYSFTPSKYDKTMVLLSGMNGGERGAVLALSHFFDMLCRNCDDDETLGYLHDHVKFVVVPVALPYAVSMRSAYNVNGVNIRVNFPYMWDVCTSTVKGTAAGDQTETKLLMNLLESLKNDKLCAVMQFHTSNLIYAGRTIYYPRYHAGCMAAMADLVNNFNFDYDYADYTDKAVLAASNGPSFCNYSADKYGVNACELVWTSNLYGGAFTDYCITKYSEFIGNAVSVMARNSRYLPKRTPQPFIKHISWRKSADSDVFTINSTSSLEKMAISAYKTELDSPYNISLNGYVQLDVSSECTVTVNPALYQGLSPEQMLDNRKAATSFSQQLTLGAGSHIIPISSVLQGYYTSYNFSDDSKFCEELMLCLMFSSSVAGAAKVSAFSATLCGVPSDSAKPVEVMHPTGLAADYSGDEVPVQTVVYPLGEYTKMDKCFEF